MSARNKFISDLEKAFKRHLSNTEVLAFLKTLQSKGKELTNDYSKRIDIRFIADSIISFSEQKANTGKHLGFLLESAKITAEQGEYQISNEILNHLISQLSSTASDRSIKAEALLQLAVNHSNTANWNEKNKFIKHATKLFTELKDNKNLIRCENLLGTAYCEIGNFDSALEHFEKARKINNPESEDETSTMIDVNIGLMTLLVGKFDLSYSFLKRSLLYYEKKKDLEKIARVRHNLGIFHIEKKEYDKALKEFEESITVSEENNYLPIHTLSLVSKAFIYSEISDLGLSNYFAAKAFDFAHSMKDILTIADVYKIKGMNFRKSREFELSKIQFLNAIRINKDFQNQLNFAETNHQMAFFYIDTYDYGTALNCLNAALKYYLKSGMKFRAGEIQDLIDKF